MNKEPTDRIVDRYHSDSERLENASRKLMGVTARGQQTDTSRSSDRSQDRAWALREICSFFYIPTPDFQPDHLENEAYVEQLLRKNGIMSRVCILRPGGEKDAFGPYLCRLKSGAAAALLPGSYGRYACNDRSTGERIVFSSGNADQVEKEAVLYYRALPQTVIRLRDLLRFMLRCVSGGERLLILFSALAITLLSIFYPVACRWMMTLVIPSGKTSLIYSLFVFLLGCAIAKYLFSIVQARVVSRVSQKMSVFLQSSLFSRVLDLPVDFFRKNKTADIFGSLNLVESLCSVLCQLCFSTGLAALLSLIYIFELRTAAPAMIGPALIVLFVQMILQIMGVFGQYKTAMLRLKGMMVTNERALDTLRGVREIKNAGSEARAMARFMESYHQEADAEFRPPLFVKIQNALMPATTVLGMALLFWQSSNVKLSSSLFVYFYAAYSMSSSAVLQLSSLGSQIASIQPMLSLLRPILDEVPEVSSAGHDPGKLTGSILLNDVCFRYDESAPQVLDRLNLKVSPGEYLAIVGSSGSGKSTLVRLLLGFEQPQTGAIYYDGENLRHLDNAAVRRQIGVVLQQGKIFSGNVFTNIAISRPDLTEAEAWEAAEAAGIADDIRAMPLGMQTILSDDAATISGGQKQRLLIARVIAQKPSILILDEATSALDNITQKTVTNALANLHCTRIVIAHRLSTIHDCDRILVLNKGKITEEGTFDELLALDGEFAQLVKHQLI
jgi:NHLM bacteriocin system ABC transporter ATP-binding protein